MRTLIPLALVATGLYGCSADASKDSGLPTGSPATGSIPGTGTGSTTSSGTAPLSCSELDPGTSAYGPDDLTPAGHSANDALAPMLAFGSTLTWDADGSSTALTGSLAVEPGALNIRHDPVTDHLTVCVDLLLATDDGRMSASLVADELVITAIGEASLSKESNAIHHVLDAAMVGGDDQARLQFDLAISQATTSGTLQWQTIPGGTWASAAGW